MFEARPPSVAPRPPQATSPGAPAGRETPPAETAPVPDGERPDALASDVARAVRDLRASAGLSERAAARLLGTSQTQLRRMEDPRYLPSLRSLARLAAAYGHRLKIAFEPKDRGARSATKTPPVKARPAPRAKRAAATRSPRVTGRARRRP